jgi:hypothetical protein
MSNKHTDQPSSGLDKQREDIVSLLSGAKKSAEHELVRSAMASKGDVTRIMGYDNLAACLQRLRTIEGGKGTLGKGFVVAQRAHAALLASRSELATAFGSGGSEGVRLTYANAACALWHIVTLLCAEGVSFVKPKDGRGDPQIQVNAGGAARIASLTPVKRLEEFCNQAEKHGFKDLVKQEAAKLEHGATVLVEFWGAIAIGMAVVAGLIALLSIARWLAEYYYNTRGQVSSWLDTQAAFLQANAAALGQGSPERAAQEKRVEQLKRLADRIRVDADDAERLAKASREPDRAPTPVGTANHMPSGMLV